MSLLYNSLHDHKFRYVQRFKSLA